MKVRVLEVLASLQRAGAERVAVAIAGGLDPERFAAGVVSLFGPLPGGFEPDLAGRGVAVRHLGKRRGFDPRMWPRLARVFREFRPDIVHTHSYVLRYVLPVRAGGIVHTVHNLADREVDALGRAVNRLAFRRGAAAVAVSREVARSFREVYGFEPAAVIPNGVDTRSGFRPGARERWRRAHGFADSNLLIASVARFEPQKNPLGLIEAFARVPGHLVLAGQGSLLDAARERASQLGLANRVHFLGVCADVAELLSACDLFALASDWEGSPVAILEAMAARLPVVATAVGGVPELVEDGVTGVLAPARDVAALSRALDRLARDSARRLELGERAAARAAAFDTARMVESYARLFERLVAGQTACPTTV